MICASALALNSCVRLTISFQACCASKPACPPKLVTVSWACLASAPALSHSSMEDFTRSASWFTIWSTSSLTLRSVSLSTTAWLSFLVHCSTAASKESDWGFVVGLGRLTLTNTVDRGSPPHTTRRKHVNVCTFHVIYHRLCRRWLCLEAHKHSICRSFGDLCCSTAKFRYCY